MLGSAEYSLTGSFVNPNSQIHVLSANERNRQILTQSGGRHVPAETHESLVLGIYSLSLSLSLSLIKVCKHELVCRTHLYTAKTLFSFFEESISFTSWLSLVVHIINIIPSSKQMTIFIRGGRRWRKKKGGRGETQPKQCPNICLICMRFRLF